jgi:hypothetical protein
MVYDDRARPSSFVVRRRVRWAIARVLRLFFGENLKTEVHFQTRDCVT